MICQMHEILFKHNVYFIFFFFNSCTIGKRYIDIFSPISFQSLHKIYKRNLRMFSIITIFFICILCCFTRHALISSTVWTQAPTENS